MHGRVTLSDVAREAGVSLATASRAINGSADRIVREDLRRRVEQAAAKLRYVPDLNAQAVASGRSRTLGLIVNDITDPYFSSIAAGASEAAVAHGRQLSLATTQNDRSREPELVAMMTANRVSGLILAGSRIPSESSTTSSTPGLAGADDELNRTLEEYLGTGGTLVTVGRQIPDASCVLIDNEGGGADLADRLVDLGYRRFAVLAGPPRHETARDRTRGFLMALNERGIDVPTQRVIHGSLTYAGGMEAMEQLLGLGKADEDVQLVFAAADIMVLGALSVARAHGCEVPRRLAFAGFDDIATMEHVAPSMTTVRVPSIEVGTRAAVLALETDDPGPQTVRVGSSVIVRESTPKVAVSQETPLTRS